MSRGDSRRGFSRLTRSARGTEAFGAALARRLKPGDCVLIQGPLGAGKTTLVRGALRALGVSGPVVSPTFTLAHEANARSRGAERRRIAHLDFYRFVRKGEAAERGLMEYLDGRYFVFVEWPERDRSFWPRRPVRVRIGRLSGSRRHVRVRFPGA